MAVLLLTQWLTRTVPPPLATWARFLLLLAVLRTPPRPPSGMLHIETPLGSCTKCCRMGELEPWMDENFIKGVFLSSAGENVNVKVIRDKNSG